MIIKVKIVNSITKTMIDFRILFFILILLITMNWQAKCQKPNALTKR